MDATGQSLYTNEQPYEGGGGVAMHARRGKEDFGRWGGGIICPKHMFKGDELCWRVHTFWPKGVNYSAAQRLKILRVHACPKDGGNFGYNDVYMNPTGSLVPAAKQREPQHRLLTEGESHLSVR